MHDVDDAEVQHLVDGLLAEFGIIDDLDAPVPVAPKADRTEKSRTSWMDQVGRAKRAG